MYATFASPAFAGSCALKSCRLASCSCTSFSLGGPVVLAAPGKGEEPVPQASLQGRLQALGMTMSIKTRASIQTLAVGVNSGMAVIPSAASLISTGAISLMLTGAIELGEDAPDGQDEREAAAWTLLSFYSTHAAQPTDELVRELQAALGTLAASTFAFVLHDRRRHRVVAGRSGQGADLFWGLSADSALMLSSTLDSAMDQADCQAFPANCLFVSSVPDAYSLFVQRLCPGRLVGFHAPAPESPATPAAAPAPAKGLAPLCRITSGTDLAMITSSKGWMQRTPSMSELIAASAGSAVGSAR